MTDKKELAADINTEKENEEIAVLEDLSEEITESYGTGVSQLSEVNIGEGTMPSELAE